MILWNAGLLGIKGYDESVAPDTVCSEQAAKSREADVSARGHRDVSQSRSHLTP